MSIKRIKQSTWYGILGMPLMLISFLMMIAALDATLDSPAQYLEWYTYTIIIIAIGVSCWLMGNCSIWEAREMAIRDGLREEKKKREIVKYIRNHPEAKTFS